MMANEAVATLNCSRGKAKRGRAVAMRCDAEGRKNRTEEVVRLAVDGGREREAPFVVFLRCQPRDAWLLCGLRGACTVCST